MKEGQLSLQSSANKWPAVADAEARAGQGLRQTAEDRAGREGAPLAGPVRTLDGLHLASAALFHETLGDLTLVSHDDRIRRNARALGLAVVP